MSFSTEPAPFEKPTSSVELGPDAIAEFSTSIRDSLAGMDDTVVRVGESLTAMDAASVAVVALADELITNPDSFGIIYSPNSNGLLIQMSDSAGRMHTRQTGHRYPYPTLGYSGTVGDALESLAGVLFKVEDQRWDGTTYSGDGRAHAPTAQGRKQIALNALKAIEEITAQKGAITVSEATRARIEEFKQSRQSRT